MADPTIICVTGMGRCGTSLVARILNLLGASLGPTDHLMGPAVSNLRGHWENEPIVEVNDGLLAHFGGTWDEPPALPPGWHRSPDLAPYRQKARAIVEADFAGADLWAWKDPRSSMTMPFWQDLLPAMRYIVCLRNPLDVALSLLRRDSYTFEKSGRLWLTYTASAIAHTSGQPRLLMFYEDLMDDWPIQVRRLLTLMGRPDSAVEAATMASIGQFVDRELEHHRTPLVPSLAETAIPFATQSLYLMLRGAIDDRQDDDTGHGVTSTGMEAAVDAFSQQCLEADRLMRSAEDEAGELLDRVRRMADAVDDQERRLQTLTAQLTGLLGQKDQTATSLSEKLETVTHQLREREKQVAGMEQSVSWRWTRPLRQAKKWVRSLVGPGRDGG